LILAKFKFGIFVVFLSVLPFIVDGQVIRMKQKLIGVAVGPSLKYSHNSVNHPTIGKKIFVDFGVADMYPGTLMVGAEITQFNLRHTANDTTGYGHTAYAAIWSNYVIDGRITYYHSMKKAGINNLHWFVNVGVGTRMVNFYDRFYGHADSLLLKPADNEPKFHMSVSAGASYHIIPSLAIYAELGYSECWLAAGVIWAIEFNRRLPGRKW
jgi:hypothetical protein